MHPPPDLRPPPDWPPPEELASLPHPHFRRLVGSRTQQPDGSWAHWVVPRAKPYSEVIEDEAKPLPRDRPSVQQQFDKRGLRHKLRDWAAMARTRPLDALVLPFINRYPPMVTWAYDDSDDWTTLRWPRALQRWHDRRSGRAPPVDPIQAARRLAAAEAAAWIPPFLREQPEGHDPTRDPTPGEK